MHWPVHLRIEAAAACARQRLHAFALYIACLTPLSQRLWQVWRPTRGPVDSSPLAMIDAASVAPEDLLPNASASLPSKPP